MTNEWSDSPTLHDGAPASALESETRELPRRRPTAPAQQVVHDEPLGAGEAVIIAMEGASRKPIPITGNPFTIGRTVGSFVVDDDRVSRTHCEIERLIDGRFRLTDRSSNGTRVNEQVLTTGQRCILQNGDHIKISSHVFRVFMGASRVDDLLDTLPTPLVFARGEALARQSATEATWLTLHGIQSGLQFCVAAAVSHLVVVQGQPNAIRLATKGIDSERALSFGTWLTLAKVLLPQVRGKNELAIALRRATRCIETMDKTVTFRNELAHQLPRHDDAMSKDRGLVEQSHDEMLSALSSLRHTSLVATSSTRILGKDAFEHEAISFRGAFGVRRAERIKSRWSLATDWGYLVVPELDEPLPLVPFITTAVNPKTNRIELLMPRTLVLRAGTVAEYVSVQSPSFHIDVEAPAIEPLLGLNK